MLFIIHTPYHLYQSLKFLATEDVQSGFVIHFPPHVLSTHSQLIDVLSRKHKILVMKQYKNGLIRTIMQRFQLERLKKLIESNNFGTAMIFHDGQILSQAAAFYVRSLQRKAEVALAEDGTATYVLDKKGRGQVSPLVNFKLKLKNLYWGFDFKPTIAHGMTVMVEKRYFSNPNLIKDHQTPTEHLPSQAIHPKYLDWVSVELPDHCYIFLMDYSISPSYTKKYLDKMRDIIRETLKKTRSVFLKFHPLETRFDLAEEFLRQIKILPGPVGVEFIVEKNANTVCNLIGNASSSLLSLGSRKNIKAASIFVDLNPDIENLFKRCTNIEKL